MRLARFAMLVILPLLAAATVPEPEGFRQDNYNAPVPELLTGARTVDAGALAEAMAKGAIAIDVLAAPRRPPSLPQDRPWLPVPRMNVPGSLWWPEVGRGAISPALDDWFRARLAAVTSGDEKKSIAFYCKADCWMCWNAAKRAISYGYRNVLWFPGGVEAWEGAGYKLQPATPEAVPLGP
jgi:PQQ-dependent catabolism-associated CXXCW motif protein